MVAAVAADPSVEEVILSGGDPLMLPDERLAALVGALAEVPHLRRLRVHSRMPVVLPERIDDALLEWLAGTRLTPVMVVHANHARELDTSVLAALGRLRAVGVTVLNQSVLLRGVNDSVAALAELCRALLEAGVLPYYLHLLDPVAGAAHFDVPEPEARALVSELMTVLPGYLVPRLVRELPGALAKIPVTVRLPAGTRC
jgi:KamA family protein